MRLHLCLLTGSCLQYSWLQFSRCRRRLQFGLQRPSQMGPMGAVANQFLRALFKMDAMQSLSPEIILSFLLFVYSFVWAMLAMPILQGHARKTAAFQSRQVLACLLAPPFFAGAAGFGAAGGGLGIADIGPARSHWPWDPLRAWDCGSWIIPCMPATGAAGMGGVA